MPLSLEHTIKDPRTNLLQSNKAYSICLQQDLGIHPGQFMSLGPTCIAASILMQSYLRNCSYPLDWAQSGYSTLIELLRYPDEIFYYRNILSPSIHYYQTKSDTHSDYTLQSSISRNIYGFPYFYNPHRPLGDVSKDYFMRCIKRAQKLFNDRSSRIDFVLADFPDQQGNRFLDHVCDSPLNLITPLVENLSCKFRVWVVRISHDLSRDRLPQITTRLNAPLAISHFRLSSTLSRNDDLLNDITGPIYARMFLRSIKICDASLLYANGKGDSPL